MDTVQLLTRFGLTRQEANLYILLCRRGDLTGYEAAVQETARLTDTRAQLDDGQIDVINRQLVSLKARIGEQPTATITFFLPDSRKEGGAYQTVSGAVRKIDEMEQLLWMADGTKIPIPDIYEVICPDPSPEYDDIL